jgi:hypothetical protein
MGDLASRAASRPKLRQIGVMCIRNPIVSLATTVEDEVTLMAGMA